MTKKSKRRTALGLPDNDHIVRATHALGKAKLDADNIGPNCYGAIKMISRAREHLAEARAHLWSVDSPKTREQHTDLYAKANRLDAALQDKLQTAADRCTGRMYDLSGSRGRRRR